MIEWPVTVAGERNRTSVSRFLSFLLIVIYYISNELLTKKIKILFCVNIFSFLLLFFQYQIF